MFDERDNFYWAVYKRHFGRILLAVASSPSKRVSHSHVLEELKVVLTSCKYRFRRYTLTAMASRPELKVKYSIANNSDPKTKIATG